MKIDYRIRGYGNDQGDLRGKSRVFFAAHPDDYGLYHDRVVEMLHKHQNCAIYFYNEEELRAGAEEPDIEGDLSEMNLVVIPVTTKLLTRENIAVSGILPFALEKHIPVLPLMLEGGLEDVYKKHFGDLQYLDPNSRDDTAISFDEKLEKYLSGVLVGDELAQKVRDAFKAYIFMSYRKKDRKFAHELMRMIHSDDRFRDIAIWYDEYLVPGESFTDAIKEALEKSELFALVVTPNLLEEGNYVMRHEYPMANEHKKPILPFEMDETDRNILKELFENIPECLKKEDMEVREKILLSYLGNIALTGRKDDPFHNYLIGLAYLDGIDVEVDNEKAAGLITEAAEAGLAEAMEKLVSMYRDGNGVTRDYEKAIEWQERIVENARNVFNADDSSENRGRLISSLWNLGDSLIELKKYEKAKMIFLEMQDLSEGINNFSRYHSLSCSFLGDTEKGMGNLKEARYYYEKSLKENEVIKEESGTLVSLGDLSFSYGRMGDIEKVMGNPEKACEYYGKSLDIELEIKEKSETVESRRNLSVSYGRMGDIEKELYDLKKSFDYYDRSLGEFKRIAEESGSIEDRYNLYLCYGRIGDIVKAMEGPEKAREYYEKSLEGMKEIKEKSGTLESRRNLHLCYGKMGVLEMEMGRFEIARKYYKMSLGERQSIIEECGTLESSRELSVMFERMGDLEFETGNYQKALECYKKSLYERELLNKRSNTLESRRDLSIGYERMGDIEKVFGGLEIAREYYKKSLDEFERIKYESGTVESRRNLSVSYLKMGDLEIDSGNPEKALKYYKKSLELGEIIKKESNTIESCQILSLIFEKLGDLEIKVGNLQKAKEYYEKLLEIREEVKEKSNTLKYCRYLWGSYIKSGQLEEAMGNYEKGREYFENALNLCIEIDSKENSIESQRELLLQYGIMGDSEKNCGNSIKALEYFQNALSIAVELYEKTGDQEFEKWIIIVNEFIDSVDKS